MKDYTDDTKRIMAQLEAFGYKSWKLHPLSGAVLPSLDFVKPSQRGINGRYTLQGGAHLLRAMLERGYQFSIGDSGMALLPPCKGMLAWRSVEGFDTTDTVSQKDYEYPPCNDVEEAQNGVHDMLAHHHIDISMADDKIENLYNLGYIQIEDIFRILRAVE